MLPTERSLRGAVHKGIRPHICEIKMVTQVSPWVFTGRGWLAALQPGRAEGGEWPDCREWVARKNTTLAGLLCFLELSTAPWSAALAKPNLRVILIPAPHLFTFITLKKKE